MNKKLRDFLISPGKFLSDVFQYISWVKIVIFIMIIIIFANIGVFVYKNNSNYAISESQTFDVDKIVNPYSGDKETGTVALPFGAGMADQNMNGVRTMPDTESVFESKIATANSLDPIAKIKIVTSDLSAGFFAGDTVFLSAIDSYDPDGSIKEYRWDFDQSNGLNIDATGVTSTVKYNTPGVYTVTLTVIDEAGLEDFTSLTLTIQKAPDEKPNILGVATSLIDFSNLDYTSRAEVTNSIENSYAQFYMAATSTLAQAIYNSQAKTLPALPALSDIELSVTKDAKYGLTIDSVIPRESSSIYEQKPVISATFYGSTPTDMDSIELSVDGISVTQYTTKMQYGVNYVPTEPLSFGTHHATLIVADENGKKISKSWTFHIKDKNADMDEFVPSYVDEQGPQIILRVPDSNAKDFKPSIDIKLSYDEPVDTDSFQLAVVNKETNVSQIFTGTMVEWNATNTSAIIKSQNNIFEYETSYQIITRQKDELGNESVQEWFVTTEDYGAPTITINSPKNNSVVNEPELKVSGYADPTYLVIVDGVTATVSDNGMFTATISLEVGENKLEIVSKDLNGKKDTQHLTITYDPASNDGNPVYVSQDTPIIVDASIRDGESVKEVRPQISFVYADSDGIDTNSVKLYIDDEDVTGMSFITRDSITYKPITDLKQGKHTLQLIVADENKNTTKYDMDFTIDAYPEAPEQLTAKLSNNNKNVLLMWDTVTNKNNPEYRVYRSTSKGVTTTAAYEVARVSTTTWEDTEVIDGITYYYIVAAASADDVIGDASNEVKIRVDSTPPDFQILKPMKDEETPYQNYTLEGILNDNDVAKISVYLNNRLYATPTANDDKIFTVDLVLEPGNNILQTIVVDNDGNETIDIRMVTYIPPDVDRPFATYLSPKGTDIDVSTNIVIKYNEQMDFERVKLWIKPVSNTDEVVPITSNDITLTISEDLKTITYNPAENLEYLTEYSVVVEAWDVSGNLSLDDDWNFITAPKDAPILDVTTPVEGAEFDTPNIFVSGITEPAIKVTIQINGRNIEPDITSLDNGSFSKLIQLDDYDNIIKIIATDKYNNTTTVIRNVRYNKADTSAPTVIITSPETNSYVGHEYTTITGKAEPGSTVVITVNGKNQGEVTLDANGNFSHVVKLERGINEVKVKATDTSGNTTIETIIITYDAIGPIIAIQNPPDGFTTNMSRLEVRGMIEASDYQATTRLYLTVNSGPRIEVAVLRDGGFNQFINLESGINIIKIYGEDSYGNITEKSLNVYYDPIGTTGELANPSNTTNGSGGGAGGLSLLANPQNTNTNTNQTANSTPLNTTQNSTSNFANVNTSNLINGAMFANPSNATTYATNGSNTYTNNYENGNSGGTTDVVDPTTDERRYYGGDNGAPDLSVHSENGNITNDSRNTISGTTEPEANVIITQNGQNKHEGRSDSGDGTFQADIELNEGHNIITTTSTDDSGNMSFNTQVVELDTTGPILNVFTPKYKEKIGTNTYLVTGNTESKTKTEIYVGGVLKSQFTSTQTGFIQQEIELTPNVDEGNQNIKIVVYDKLNNSTVTEIPVYIDITDPRVATLNIRDAFSTKQNLAIKDNRVTTEGEQGILIGSSTPFAYGTTEPNAKVQISQYGNILGSTTADEDGEFEFKFGVSTSVYSQDLKFKVTDTFGNSSTYDFVLKTDAVPPSIKVHKPSGVMTTDGTTNTVEASLDDVAVSRDNNGASASAKLQGTIIVNINPVDDGQIELEVVDASDYIDYKVYINGNLKLERNNVPKTRIGEQGNIFHITENIGTFGTGTNKIEFLVTDAAQNTASDSVSVVSLNSTENINYSTSIDRGFEINYQGQGAATDVSAGYNSISVTSRSFQKNYYKTDLLKDVKDNMVRLTNESSSQFVNDITENPFGNSNKEILKKALKEINLCKDIHNTAVASATGAFERLKNDFALQINIVDSISNAVSSFVSAVMSFVKSVGVGGLTSSIPSTVGSVLGSFTYYGNC